MKYLKIYTDGGARGNPGPAAIGIVIKSKTGKTIYQEGKTIGKATNNQAEYQGLIHALEWVKENTFQVNVIDCFLDSKLVVAQMKGEFKIKSLNIKSLWQKAKTLEKNLRSKINYYHIFRELNSEADQLLNQALDLTTGRQVC